MLTARAGFTIVEVTVALVILLSTAVLGLAAATQLPTAAVAATIVLTPLILLAAIHAIISVAFWLVGPPS